MMIWLSRAAGPPSNDHPPSKNENKTSKKENQETFEGMAKF
ncbi:MAG: hypothetical protein ACTSRA_02815 [Promethearchaeota archaeon]